MKSRKQAEDEILSACGAMVKITAGFACYIGCRLVAIKAELERGEFLAWIDKVFPFSQRTARRYMKLYKHFKENSANFAQLETLKLTEALRQAGIIEPKEKNLLQFEPEGDPDQQRELPWEEYFELPPLSRDVKLKDHRFEIPNSHEIYLIRRGIDYPIKIAEVLAPEDKRLRTVHRGMMEAVQSAIERYYQELERIEALTIPTK
jgi:hypothetical protein